MAGGPDRVRVVLTRSGGLLGRPVSRGLDTADLSAEAAAQLRHLVEEVREGSAGAADPPAGSSSGVDRFVYTLEIHRAGERLTRTFTEAVPAELRPLVDLLRGAPRLPPGRPVR
ncbi:protealysin inhibitor emfourin [Frankia sp. AgB32]|uniref:protealysin inhibitor emfourin n=1 Tax=Frankia sp. AgB32 TaxID=631119 RepID=UPI002010B1E8|nr:protealysin inhibitor emfourin [Frankia sp. AgB32]MCK9893582.1 hypothetical protein [Frankia sp. AgB32]